MPGPSPSEHRQRSDPPRRTLFDALVPLGPDRNLYCRRDDLGNEASVETFFASRLIQDLGFADSQVRTKESLEKLAVARGRRQEPYRPDYALMVDDLPVCIIEAKGTGESLDKWIGQCSGYCLALNRKFADSNPAAYFVVTNGLSTQVFAWDQDEPLLELDFADYDWSNGAYQRLRAILNPAAIASNHQPSGVANTLFSLASVKAEQARQLFAVCHNIIRKEGGGAAYAFHEFVKVLFVKLWLDDKLRNDPLTGNMFDEGAIRKNIPKDSVIFSVHWIESREREGVVNPIDSILFMRLRDEIEQKIMLDEKKRIFEPDEHIRLNPDTVKDIVRRLEHYDLFGVDEDLNGRLFETYLSATMRGRELGQYFTPRAVVELMTRLADLQVTRTHQDRVWDACCGSGGFLIEALTIMRNTVRANDSLSDGEKAHLIGRISNHCLYGMDFAKDPPLARVARINMYLHGDGGSRIYEGDALDKDLAIPQDARPELVASLKELQVEVATSQFDVVLTNPPFSMTKERKKESDLRILTQYRLARQSPTSSALRPSLRSNIMFIERYAEMLRPGGKFITVIDDTLLSSDQGIFRSIRTFIREQFLVRAIISLPGDAFRRQGSRVKTSILVLEKKHQSADTQPACYGFFAERLGVDDLAPRASLADIEEARRASSEEIHQILTEYQQFLAGGEVANGLILPSHRLEDRLDLKSCAPELGRMADQWQALGAEIKLLRDCVVPSNETITPTDYPNDTFTLLKVTYGGRCQVDSTRKGSRIKAKSMYRVREGQLVFSMIRATDGAIGIVPPEFDGALVSSDSYVVLTCDTPQGIAYIWAVLRSHELRADMQAKSKGSGRYVTEWPDVGEWLQVPWLPDVERQRIGNDLMEGFQLEREALARQRDALTDVHRLGIESESSIARWQRSKAPK